MSYAVETLRRTAGGERSWIGLVERFHSPGAAEAHAWNRRLATGYVYRVVEVGESSV